MKAGDIYPTIHGETVTVIKYEGSMRVTVEFNDNYKHRQVFQSDRVRKGGMKNPYKPSVYGVGFLGVGKYKAQVSGKMTKHYTIWKAMLRRCYCQSSTIKHPTYHNVTVCKEWHNFQNFAKWYSNQGFYDLDYELDKDLLVVGNKVYSPETCCLVPQMLNALTSDCYARRGKYPIGVTYQKRHNSFRATFKINGKDNYLGLYKSPVDAGEVYISEKEKYIKEVANKWRGRIDERVYEALMNFNIKERQEIKCG